MGKWRLRKRGMMMGAALLMAAALPAAPGRAAEAEKEASGEGIPELTIWLDPDSEAVFRQALDHYGWFRDNYKDMETAFPALTWKLVDKSYLSPGQLEAELKTALEAGEGPDLIYMDEYNGISPKDLMEQGYLMELEDLTFSFLGGGWEYLPGVLEAGQLEGRQYALPVYLQCPVVFGLEDTLAEAGLDPEKEEKDMEALLEALLAASEKTGKQIFESAVPVDWMERYCLPLEEEERARARELLDQVRGRCGDSQGFFSPYESLSHGEALLSGFFLETLQKAAQNLGLFDKETGIAFLPLPGWDGEIQAVIPQAVAVNKNTAYPAEAKALLKIFQDSYVNSSSALGNYLPATASKSYWQQVLSDASLCAVNPLYEKKGRQISGTEQVSRRFLMSTQKAVTSARFWDTSSLCEESPEDSSPVKTVLTVGFRDQGMGEEHPIYQWLMDTAGQYSNDTIHVQLVPAPMDVHVRSWMWSGAGIGTDLILYSAGILDSEHSSPEERALYANLAPLLPDGAANLNTVEADGEIKGISFGTFLQSDGSPANDIFLVSQHSALKEEAVAFCLEALQNEHYETAVRAAKLTPAE